MEHIERAGRQSAVKVRALILTIFSPFLPFFEKHSAKLKYCILAMAVCLIERRKKKSLLEKWYGEKERSSLFSIYYASSICGPSTDDSHFIC